MWGCMAVFVWGCVVAEFKIRYPALDLFLVANLFVSSPCVGNNLRLSFLNLNSYSYLCKVIDTY